MSEPKCTYSVKASDQQAFSITINKTVAPLVHVEPDFHIDKRTLQRLFAFEGLSNSKQQKVRLRTVDDARRLLLLLGADS